MHRSFLNTFRPLVATEHGRKASVTYGIPPFVDGSIRREPDLEHLHPAISCLCRTDKFAPRLAPDDIVGYMTVKGRYGDDLPRHRRLVAVLRVCTVLSSHAEGAAWYSSRGMALPNNCMVENNPPKPLEHSHGRNRNLQGLDGELLRRAWDRSYRQRAAAHGTFVVCEVLFRDLSWHAPIISDDHLRQTFGRLPATRNPGALTNEDFMRLLELLAIRIPPCAL